MTQMNVTKDLINKRLTFQFSIDGKLDEVWQAHTERKLFEQWWGPQGWQTTTKEFKFETGGKIHYSMKCVDEKQKEFYGKESWGVMTIIEVKPMESFSYIDHFSNENGDIDEKLPTSLFTTNYKKDEDVSGEVTVVTSTCVVEHANQIEQLLESGIVEGYTSQLMKLDDMISAKQQ